MNTLTKSKIGKIQSDILASIRKVEKKHGVKITNAGGRFTGKNATLKLSVNTITSGGEVVTKEVADFDRCVTHNKFKRGDTLNDGSIVYGYKPRSRKYPYIIKQTNGKKYKVTESYILDRI